MKKIVKSLSTVFFIFLLSSLTFAGTIASGYNGSAIVKLGNATFSDEEKQNAIFENYSELDQFGRCGVAFACVCKEIMPTEKRGTIGMIKPAGWQTPQNKYDFVDGKYLYNRCHLIAFELAGENDNEKNLITGTRYMNINGMLPYENKVANHVKNTNHHVLYRSTPIYEGDNLLCEGVKLEAYCLEEQGGAIDFNVLCYNVQPGVEIDYKTGKNWASEENAGNNANTSLIVAGNITPNGENSTVYISKSGKKYHSKPSCSNMKSPKEVSEEEAINMGRTKCSKCW